MDTAVELDSDKYISAGDVTFIIALLYFASNGCDSVIIERRPSDGSAPLIESSEISVITSIYDGISPDALEELIPRGTKETVTCIQHKQTYGEISKACAEAGCRLSLPLYADLEIKKISLYNTRFTYRGSEYSLGAFSPCQLLNAITVIEAAHALARLGMSIPENAIASGLSNAHLPLMCQVLAIEPTIIVARVESDRQLEALIASLAQVCDLVHHKIDVFVSPENAGLTADLSSRLANCSIESDQPKVIDKSDLHEFNACLSSAIAPMIKGEDTKYAALFIGNSEYVSILASQIKKILGSFI